ncbi:restriction endonuclease subunit S [Cyanobium sp. FGCU-52]|nr:restriction endonuclease subunit S [Cyanobium sp. FGCU52]
MIEDLKPYPQYKDSGLPWLGEVPAHWEIRRNGGLFQQRNDSGANELPILEVSLRTGVRVRDFATSKRKQVMTDRSKYKRAGQGDLVYNMMRMWQGAAGIAPVSGLISPAYVVCRALPGIDSSYFSRLFKTDDYLAEIDAASRGIVKDRNRLYWDQFKQICSPLPPASEQVAIARFLTWATNRLDRAIGAKRRIIALLQEQKQAIIHRAVTRGLDPAVPLKDSGIPWLGEIPEHWEVRRAKYLFREVDRRSQTGTETHLAMSQRLGLVPSSMVQSTLRSQSYAGGKLCSSGDLVLNRLKAHLGVFAVAKQDGVISPDYTVLREQALAHADYYACILKSPGCRGELQTRAKGIVEGFWRLYTDDFYEIRLPTPPIDEQLLIMDLASQQTRGQETAISRLESEITLLREYRTRLIADVVTGKLDVREVAKGLPEDVEPPIQSDAAGYDGDEAEDDSDSDPIDTEEV